MNFWAWGVMALLLYPPIGPVGFTAGEQMLRGERRAFFSMASAVLIADIAITSVILLAMTHVPRAPDGHIAANVQWIWSVMGAALLYVGYRAWSRPTAKGASSVDSPFRYGLRWTFLLPANYAGVLAVFGTAYAAGTIPSKTLDGLIMAMTLGVVAGFLWIAWGLACYILSRQERISLATLGRVFQKMMAGSIVMIALGLIVKPFEVLPF